MNNELLNNPILQEHLNALRDGASLSEEQPLGKYGRMAMKHLQETNPQRFSLLMMQGKLMKLLEWVDEKATEQVECLMQSLLAHDPVPPTEDTLVRARHMGKHRNTAEEIVINELVLIPR